MKKRTGNLTSIKIKWLGATNTLGARIKITQLNNNESVTLGYDYSQDTLNTVFLLLEKCHAVSNYNIIIDNTQDNYYLIMINYVCSNFFNLIEWIKKNEK